MPPASSSCFLNASASSFFTPSFKSHGALSAFAFASPRPNPVIALTALIIATLLVPTPVKEIVYSDFSSPAASPPPASALAGAATGAAAA